ncbi:MAG: hypothetical protein GY725_04660 [bacterium]|nr:hypothetical protein [bacterium]
MSRPLEVELAARGFNITGSLPRELYDSIAPPAWRASEISPDICSVLIVGHAGRGFWERFRVSPEAELDEDPLDRFAQRSFVEIRRDFPAVIDIASYTAKRDGAYLPLQKLGSRAGFGTPGRLGLLIHPEFGPWLAMRAVFFLSEETPRSGSGDSGHSDFEPCVDCPAPCATACHGGAISANGIDLWVCTRSKTSHPPCTRGCDARRACVVGSRYAYGDEQLEHHSMLPWIRSKD